MPQFGDYIVFVDESGDQSLKSVDDAYPVFVLAFCIFHKEHYCDFVLPKMTQLKFKYWGKDTVIFHEREMRQKEGDFAFLNNPKLCRDFFHDLNEIMVNAEYVITSTLLDKRVYKLRTGQRTPYDVAAQLGMERVFYEMQSRKQRGSQIPIIFESRGKKEDNNLLSAVETIRANSAIDGFKDMFDCCCISKQANSIGLQFADMIARPVGNHYLYPKQANRAWDMLLPKMRKGPEGEIEGFGLKIFS
ncbi:3-deoxy-D-manno-octulosonic acid transferase [Bombiscardovia apis]|uniref:3-deoxy-D-manno-octulosonic acid transferase n=1 Tax=Bombiscardovia apis TaxID=2932182 RepID=A0ABN6SJV0_9BIFI|nr:DUF3800 domain-containing protein [Bombiscardovia apis]BDR55393.1 3-deoxy-D-manno-octulosonic acid transferase [Bombiscardovia apis]